MHEQGGDYIWPSEDGVEWKFLAAFGVIRINQTTAHSLITKK